MWAFFRKLFRLGYPAFSRAGLCRELSAHGKVLLELRTEIIALKHDLHTAALHGIWRKNAPLSAHRQLLLPPAEQKRILREAQARIDSVVAAGGSQIETLGFARRHILGDTLGDGI